ncbi:J domain-containing protein [Gracilibacillus salinarum]|uniref:DnaJ domain-containing protein n=1 Tax=Gracilibacillus salinarum TaxID=2932255 RepID=A0ABY4GIK2_9BACI|nr:DnaJ domain-containing protein [Gracilibacillus salinarum]UOQ83597.1 DnaJ domain-containing protein [Gracilibacillus salinarum]
MTKETIENHYEILGINANIDESSISEKYRKAIQEYSPETDPEGLEKLQKAYEILKDPIKRKEYDIYRKYGDKEGSLIENALSAIQHNDSKKAEDLLQQADPDNLVVKAGLMQVAGLRKDRQEVESWFADIFTTVLYPEEAAIMFSIKANVLFGMGDIKEAIETLQQGMESIPEHTPVFAITLANLYDEIGESEKALETLEHSVSVDGNDTLNNGPLYILWLEMVIMYKEWSALSNVQRTFEKFIKHVTRQEDRDDLYHQLMLKCSEHHKQEKYREAEVYLNLLTFLTDKNDPEIKQLQDDIKNNARIQKELGKVAGDEDIFPMVHIKAAEWFYSYKCLPEHIADLLNEESPSTIEDFETHKAEYAAGIVKLRKKYPLLYKQYKEKWDSIFAELTADFNRKLRRDLLKVK